MELSRRHSAHLHLAFLQSSLVRFSHNSFPEMHNFPFAIFSAFMFLPRQAGSQCKDLEAFPANCQLVNLIGLSPWAPFLNQLGGKLAVTSFSQAGCLEAHHPGEVKHPNGKMLTSAAEKLSHLKIHSV